MYATASKYSCKRTSETSEVEPAHKWGWLHQFQIVAPWAGEGKRGGLSLLGVVKVLAFQALQKLRAIYRCYLDESTTRCCHSFSLVGSGRSGYCSLSSSNTENNVVVCWVLGLPTMVRIPVKSPRGIETSSRSPLVVSLCFLWNLALI